MRVQFIPHPNGTPKVTDEQKNAVTRQRSTLVESGIYEDPPDYEDTIAYTGQGQFGVQGHDLDLQGGVSHGFQASGVSLFREGSGYEKPQPLAPVDGDYIGFHADPNLTTYDNKKPVA